MSMSAFASEPGYSGSAPSPQAVSASGEYPSRTQTPLIRLLTEAFWSRDWSDMDPAARMYARNHMTDALRASGLALTERESTPGIEACKAEGEALGTKSESPVTR